MAKRILVVDDDMMCLKTVQRYLAEENYDVLGALSGMQAIHIVQETKIDLLLLDIEMASLSGFATLEQIRELPNGKQLPVIFFTGRKDRDTVKRCAAIGAEGYIAKPVEKLILHERVKEVLSRMSTYQEERTVLIVDDDVEFLKRLKHYLKNYYKVIAVSSGKSALDYLSNHTADVMLLDYAMPLFDGAAVLKMLQNLENGRELPVIMLCEDEVAEVKEICRTTPANAYLKKTIDTDALLQNIQKQFDE